MAAVGTVGSKDVAPGGTLQGWQIRAGAHSNSCEEKWAGSELESCFVFCVLCSVSAVQVQGFLERIATRERTKG